MKNERTNSSFDSLLDDLVGDDDKLAKDTITANEKETVVESINEVDNESTTEENIIKTPKAKTPLFGNKNKVASETKVEEVAKVKVSSPKVDKPAPVQKESKEVVTEDSTTLDLLDELTGESLHERAAGKLALDNSAYEVKVTPDGRTLSEVIPSLRKGAKSADQMVQDIVDETKSVEVFGEKYADGRYKSHLKSIEKKKKHNDERREFSSKFLQKNAQFTEQEKIIMENLGVSNEQFANIMKKGKLSDKDREAVLAAGKYGAEQHFKGRRYRTTVGDMALVDFLTKFKFANTRVLRWIKDEPQSRTWRKLNRLRENGLAVNKTIIGIPDLWSVTAAGVSIAGYALKPGLQTMPKMSTISSTMGVNYLAACLWFNTVNVLNLEGFPGMNRVAPSDNGATKKVQGEMLVSELEIRSSLGRLISPQGELNKRRGESSLYEVVSGDVRKAFRQWEEGGRVGMSPEVLPGNEYMWVLYPRHQLTYNYHVPDLVVRRDRNEDGSPESIAVEVERYPKQSNSYEKIMRAYKLDKVLYKKVIWVTSNTQVVNQIKSAAEAVGFENYDIVPIITKAGVFTDGDIWMI